MKIVKKNIKFFTNIEAKEICKNFESNPWLEDVIKYIKQEKTVEVIAEIKKKLKDAGLFEFEIIQLVNIWPTQILHLQLIIEEMEERFSENDLNKILEIFKKS